MNDVHLQENDVIETPHEVELETGPTVDDVLNKVDGDGDNGDVLGDVDTDTTLQEYYYGYESKSKPYCIPPHLSPEIVIETFKDKETNEIVSGAKPSPSKYMSSTLISATTSIYFYSFGLANLKPHFVTPSATEYIQKIAGK